MAYVLPSFNLLCRIYTHPAAENFPTVPAGPARLSDVACALVYGRRVNVGSTGGTDLAGTFVVGMSLLLPASTDIRGYQDSTGRDAVEVPQGSGRWYAVGMVDDIGKGWPNEHRTASLLAGIGMWVAPYA